MKIFFIQFERDDDNMSSMLTYLKSIGETHQILDSLYCLITESNYTTLSLRDTLLELSEDSRIMIFNIPGELNSAWHLTIENSNWLKSILNGK